MLDSNLNQNQSIKQNGYQQISEDNTTTTKNLEGKCLTDLIEKTSQRKLQLIQELLSPERYDQVNAHLLSQSYDSSPLEGSAQVDSGRNIVIQQNRKLDLLEDFLNDSLNVTADTLENDFYRDKLKDNLIKKREAIDFFFREPQKTLSSNTTETLTIELKSGYYLSVSPESEQKVMKKCVYSLFDRFFGLLNVLGSFFDKTPVDDPFVSYFQRHNSSPFARTNNLMTMKSRLESDKQLDKIQIVLSNSNDKTEELQVDIANEHCLRFLPAQINLSLGGIKNKQVSQLDERLISHLNERLVSKHFSLESFVSNTTEDKSCARYNLLIWRWLNGMKQPIYLSERDNIKMLALQMEEKQDEQVEQQVKVAKLEVGYKSIEQIRLAAVEYIRQYELKLEQMLSLDEENANTKGTGGGVKLSDVLIEQRLRVNLSGVARAASKFVPRRRAKRPLMAQRRSVNRDVLIANKDIESNSSLVDLKKQTFNQWQRFVQQRNSNLQLVVAVQQASNVPMRVIRPQEQQQQHLRPATPHFKPASPFAPSPVSFLSQTSNAQPGNVAANDIRYLSSPTTYVELVFQRNQQATSLAQGKSPAWNETLVFPVITRQLADQVRGEEAELAMSQERLHQAAPAHNKLVDECLQLNLYDYRSLVVADQSEEFNNLRLAQERAWPTTGELVEATETEELRAQRLVSSRQRVERHLLGSLRIPLTTLLTSGKIQGSFPLNQPLFLDDYHFERNEQTSNNSWLVPTSQATQKFTGTAQSGTSISLFITLDPPISMPMQLYLATGSSEEERVFEYARLWEKLLINWFNTRQVTSAYREASKQVSSSAGKTQRRHIRALVLQSDCKYCLINRLLRPVEPPEGLLNLPETQQQDGDEFIIKKMTILARFVSLMKPLKYGLFNMRLLASNVWFNTAQLVEQSLGGPEEKAVLLCNLFLHQGHCSALLLGDAIPEGRCVYVIVWSEQSRVSGHEQLQLQASNLLEAISVDSPLSSIKRKAQPITADTFVQSLPILASSKSVQLWDANTGRVYTLADQLPLVSVGCIVSGENVYANVQSNDRPAETNYDIRLRQFWFPLFEGATGTAAKSAATSTRSLRLAQQYQSVNHQTGRRRLLAQVLNLRKSIGRPTSLLSTILSDKLTLNYEASFSADQCESLKTLIENVIKAHLLRWRPQRPTYFNRTLSRLIGEKLALFEGYYNGERIQTSENITNSVQNQTPNWHNELAELVKSQVLAVHLTTSSRQPQKQVVSWPINMTYTGMKAIVEALYASGVHNADLALHSNLLTTNTQFLVASHINSYPSRVVSVWIYVAAVVTN